MTQDLLAPCRTTPPTARAAAAASAARERHRSVADGELVNPWTLGEFFDSLNSVMRLPSRPRRKLEESATPEGGLNLAIASVRPAFPRGLLVLGAAAAIAIVVIRPIVLWASDSGQERLNPVLGVWEADSGRWAGRSFEVSDSSIAFRSGEKRTDYSWHRIHEVRVKAAVDSALYTVVYEESGRTAEFTFWFKAGAAPAIRLKNTPAVVWSRSARAATAQPRT